MSAAARYLSRFIRAASPPNNMAAAILSQPAAHPARIRETPFAGPVAWTRDTLAPEDGVLYLDADCRRELDHALGALRANPLPTLVLEPAAFELPACGGLMLRAKAVLESGVGFVLIDRLSLDDYSVEEAKALYWLLAQLLSRPVAQSWDGKMIYDVRDLGRPPGNGVRPDITNAEQSFHTDNSYNLCPPDYVALLCLQPAMEGGVSSIVSFHTAHNEMLARHPGLLARLYAPFLFDRQREHAPGAAMVLSHPLFEYDGERLAGRLSRFQVRNGYALAEMPLDAEGEAALEALDQIMKAPRVKREFFFERGQIQILDNRRLGHRRTAFQDFPEPERKRHLVRLWLRDWGRRFYNG
jgi:alpha-ketoglutarate-dependent taurine dioxygenase